MKYFSVPLVTLAVVVLLLFHWQRQLDIQFREHWHYAPKTMTISVDEPHIGHNPPYYLTKAQPQKEAVAEYWNYVVYYRRR